MAVLKVLFSPCQFNRNIVIAEEVPFKANTKKFYYQHLPVVENFIDRQSFINQFVKIEIRREK
jgi:hypothetical protein